jgi:uncharacterized membrane protein
MRVDAGYFTEVKLIVRKKSKDEYHLIPLGATPEQLIRKLHSFEGRLANLITNFSGSMYFVYFSAILFIGWFLLNDPNFNHWFPPFDPFPYGLLTMIVSLEAIFLSAFILINQNRQATVDTIRELEEEQEEQEEEKEQEELEADVQDIQKDLDDIKNAMIFIQQKIGDLERNPSVTSESKSSK